MSHQADVDVELPSPAERRRQFRRALAFIKPDKWAVSVVLVLAFLLAGLGALEPLVMKFLFDALAEQEPVRTLGIAVGMLAGLYLVKEGVGALSNWLTWRVRLRVQYRLQEAAVERLHTLPLSYHRDRTVGDTMTRVDRAVAGFIGAVSTVAFSTLPSILYLLIAVVLMARLDWRLTLIVAAFAPLPALIGAWAAREQSQREQRLLDKWARIYSRFQEVLGGIITVKSFSMEDAEKDRFLRDVDDANGVVARGVARDSTTGAAMNLTGGVASVTVMGVGGYLVLQGQVTLGTLVAFLGYVGGLFGPVQGLTGIYQTVQRASISLATIYSILDAEDHLRDKPGAEELPAVRGDVRFENVGMSYTPGRPVIHCVDLAVEPAETVALVGPSGAGKTTLMALLQRLYDPSEGRILVDGRDLKDIQQKSLRRQIGVVLQDPVLFNDTVRNVIAYARPDATDQEVEAAARAAYAHDFIMELPNGYETKVGERGGRLSMGQRQRLAIARAILKDPSMVILDEATSALDAESEAAVQKALARLVRGRTTFVIAHRLATVVNADRICVLKDGRILEEGSHRELMAKNGYYAELVAHQTRGLLDVDWEEHEEGPAPGRPAGWTGPGGAPAG